MRRFSSLLVSSSFLAIAASIFVVGVVWASSGALQTSSNSSTVATSTVPTDEEDDAENGEDEVGDGDLPGIDPGDEIDELRRLVVDLTTQVETLTRPSLLCSPIFLMLLLKHERPQQQRAR